MAWNNVATERKNFNLKTQSFPPNTASITHHKNVFLFNFNANILKKNL